VSVSECRIGPGGGLELDRVWALYSADNQCINGKSAAGIHLIRATFAPDTGSVALSVSHGGRRIPPQEFAFPGDFSAAGEWFSAYFGRPVVVRYAPEGFPDDTLRNGPMVISTATLQAVAGWFPGLTFEESRRRFRSPLEIGGVCEFWEDRLFGEQESNPALFTVGEVHFEGTNPCPRCVVPARDSRSGADTSGFQRRFSELRRAQYPSWACRPDRINHFYHLGINTRVAPTEAGKALRVGDPVTCTNAIT
jgi:uncharacterized protein YcbX